MLPHSLMMAIALATSGPEDRAEGNEAVVRINETVALGDAHVTPIAILRDTRCVEDRTSSDCFGESGTLVLRLLVEQDGKTSWLDVPAGGLKRWRKLAIAITGVKPIRRDTAPIPSDAYSFSIRRLPADVKILQ